MPEHPLWQHSATDLAALIARQDVSPSEVVKAFLDRIDDVDERVNAFTVVDAHGARKAARQLEASLRRGDQLGPLAGVPVAVKDLIFTRGLLTTGGSAAYRNHVPDVDDVVVERVRTAGGIVIGKTNVPPFGFGPGTSNATFGATRNPWALDHTPGGSSGGSSAAVAAGMAPLALGSDGGGSIRIPASFCGVVGLKPTFGVVPLHPGCRDERLPGFSAWETLEHIGPIARSVEDAILLTDVIAGPDPRDRHSVPRSEASFAAGPGNLLQRARIGCATILGPHATIDPAVDAVFQTAVARLRGAGVTVVPIEVGIDDPGPMYDATIALESDLAGLRRLARTPGALNERIERMLARRWTFTDASDAVRDRKGLVRRIGGVFSQVDLFLTPTVAVPPHPLDFTTPMVAGRAVDDPRWLLWLTMPFNLTGHPAISLPAEHVGGLPIGIQLVGPRLADRYLLQAAREIEAIMSTTDSWPPL